MSVGRGNDIDFNVVTSIFGKGNNNIIDWIERGFANYINKEKALDYLHHSVLETEALSNPRLSSITKIVEKFENPNIADENMREGDGAYTDDEVGFENDPVAKLLGQSRRTAKQRRKFAQRERQRQQQRYTNRLITLYDWIMRASAKGVLMMPEDCLPDGVSIDDIAESWTEFNGVIVYKPSKSGKVPEQVANNSTNIGIAELLNMQLKFFEDISGVTGALQGKPGYSGESASHYNQQTENATKSLLDLLECFSCFVVDGAYKDVKNMQQFYDSKRVFNIAGKSGAQIEYDPKKIRDVEFDLSITESTSTPAYRHLANDMLMQLYQSQAISVEQLLEHGDFPFADELLQSIKSQKEQLEQGKVPDGLSPELMAQAQQGANMQAVNKLNNAIRQ